MLAFALKKRNGYMKDFIIKSIKAGAPAVFFASFFCNLMQFCNSMFLVRILSKANYGVFSYSFNIISFFLLLNSGFVSAILQFCSEKDDLGAQRSYFFLGIKYLVLVDLISAVVIFVVAKKNLLSIESANRVFLLMFFIPLLSGIYNCCLVFLRAKILNVVYSISSSMNAIFLLSFTVLGAYLFGINGAVAFQYLAYLSSLLFILSRLKKYLFASFCPNNFVIEKSSFISYAIMCFFANAIGQLVFIANIFLIGFIIKQPSEVAIFKVASSIPFALFVIPSSLMVFIYPFFVRKKNDKQWIKKHTLLLVMFLFIINLLVVMPLIVFAKEVIFLIFSSIYANDGNLILIFRLLLVGYLFAGSLGYSLGNILAMLRRSDLNLICGSSVGIIGLALTYVFINKYGVLGAAYSTFIIFVLSSIVNVFSYFFAVKKIG